MVSGVRTDKVAFLFDAMSGSIMTDWKEKSRSWVNGIKEYCESCSLGEALYSAEQDLLDALIAGRHYDGRQRTTHSPLSIARPGDHIVGLVPMDEQMEGHEMRSFHANRESQWLMHVMLVIMGRRLAITRNGQVGLVPRYTEVGDEIVMIVGYCIPLVLGRQQQRLRGITTSVIGSCYFRRKMDGQIVEATGAAEIRKHAESIPLVPEGDRGYAVQFDMFESPPDDGELCPQWFWLC